MDGLHKAKPLLEVQRMQSLLARSGLEAQVGLVATGGRRYDCTNEDRAPVDPPGPEDGMRNDRNGL
jgi:hypothetical protein